MAFHADAVSYDIDVTNVVHYAISFYENKRSNMSCCYSNIIFRQNTPPHYTKKYICLRVGISTL